MDNILIKQYKLFDMEGIRELERDSTSLRLAGIVYDIEFEVFETISFAVLHIFDCNKLEKEKYSHALSLGFQRMTVVS